MNGLFMYREDLLFQLLLLAQNTICISVDAFTYAHGSCADLPYEDGGCGSLRTGSARIHLAHQMCTVCADRVNQC